MHASYRFVPVFAAACLSLLFFGVGVISLGSILPELSAKFGLSEVAAGGLASVLPFGILLGSLLFGPIVDRYSYRYLLIACLILVGLGLEGVAFAGSYGLLQAAFFLIGLGGGAINGGGSALVADISADRPERRGANLSLLGVFYGVGALGMPSVIGVLSRYYAYEPIVAAIGGLVLASTIYLAFVRFPAPKHTRPIPWRRVLALGQEAPLLLLGFFLFFQSGVESLVNNWTTTYLQDTGIAAPAAALYALSLSVLGLTVGRLLLTGLLRRVRAYFVLSGSLLLAAAGSALVLAAGTLPAATAGFVLIGLGLAAGFPVILSYVGDLYAELSGTAFSVVFVIALAGNMLINFLMGVLAQQFGIGLLPLVLIVCFLLMGGLLWVTLRKIAGKTRV